MRKPKKWTSWRVCPNCGSRATKFLSLDTGFYSCQVCHQEYSAPEPKPKELHITKVRRWRHNSFFGFAKMMQTQAHNIIDSDSASPEAKACASIIELQAIYLRTALTNRIDPPCSTNPKTPGSTPQKTPTTTNSWQTSALQRKR